MIKAPKDLNTSWNVDRQLAVWRAEGYGDDADLVPRPAFVYPEWDDTVPQWVMQGRLQQAMMKHGSPVDRVSFERKCAEWAQARGENND